MKLVALLVVAACGQPKPEPAPALPAPVAGLPADAELGELAIMPAPNRDLGSWIPQGTFPFLVETALREGKGPPPRWLAVDGAGAEATLTYGETSRVKYGCDDHELTVSKLDGKATLKPGLVWLRPASQASWNPKPLSISELPIERGEQQWKRTYRVGAGTLSLVRVRANNGIVEVRWPSLVYTMKFERGEMEGADTSTPMDLSEPGVGQPVPEAAWSFGTAALLVFRVPSYEGLNFKAVVVDQARGREIDPMTMYLYHCAF